MLTVSCHELRCVGLRVIMAPNFSGRPWQVMVCGEGGAQQMVLITAFRLTAAGQMEQQLLRSVVCPAEWSDTQPDSVKWDLRAKGRGIFFIKNYSNKAASCYPQHHKISGIETWLSVSAKIIKQTPPLYKAAVIRLNYVSLWKLNTAKGLWCQNSLALVKLLLSKLFLLSDTETKFIMPLLSFQRLFLKQNEHVYLCGKINVETLSHWHQ